MAKAAAASTATAVGVLNIEDAPGPSAYPDAVRPAIVETSAVRMMTRRMQLFPGVGLRCGWQVRVVGDKVALTRVSLGREG